MEENLKQYINFITEKTDGKSGFSTPKSYFEEVEKDIFIKISEENISSKNSFEVPQNYFSTIEDKILLETTKKEVKVIPLQQIISFSAVASILLFVSFLLFNKSNTISLDNISITEIENWYDNSYGITNNNEFAVLLEDSDFTNTEISSITINETVLEDYFNSIDSSELIKEIE